MNDGKDVRLCAGVLEGTEPEQAARCARRVRRSRRYGVRRQSERGKTSSGRNTNGLFQRFAKTTWSWLLGSGGFSLDVTTARIQNAPFGHVAIASPAQSASFREVTGADCAFTRGRLRRMRLCVRWLRVCAGEERRSLRAVPHGKAQSAAPASRRMRFSVTSPPGRRGTKPPASLRGTMENGPTGQTRSGNPPPGWRGVCAGARKPRPGTWPHGKAQSGQRASLRARPGPSRDTIRLPVVAKEVPGTQTQSTCRLTMAKCASTPQPAIHRAGYPPRRSLLGLRRL